MNKPEQPLHSGTYSKEEILVKHLNKVAPVLGLHPLTEKVMDSPECKAACDAMEEYANQFKKDESKSESFPREQMIGFAEWLMDGPFNFTVDRKWRVGISVVKTTSELLNEYFNQPK